MKHTTNYSRWKALANPNAPIAKALRAYRKKTKLSQRQLGKLAKFSQGYLGMLERGICTPRYNTMTKLIKAFNKLGFPCTHADFGFRDEI